MKAILSFNGDSMEANFSNEKDLFMFMKSHIIREIGFCIDELNEQIYGYIETDECLVDLQSQVEALERKAQELRFAKDFDAIRSLGYDLILVK